MPRALALALVSLLVAPLVVESLSCSKCDLSKCTPRDPPCEYGEVPGVCNCCPVCAKGPGDECGGMWNLGGRCGPGLWCFSEDPDVRGKCKALSTDACLL